MKTKRMIMASAMVFTALSAHASGAVDPRYQRIAFEIKNNTQHVEIVNLFDMQGTWQTPWAVKSSITLSPNQVYHNVLYSVGVNDDLNSYTSITVSRADSPRNNYLIFASTTSSKEHYVSGDIFDGLGSMFVASWTNECQARTPEGYTDCKLTINE